jgi:hypothetical protein
MGGAPTCYGPSRVASKTIGNKKKKNTKDGFISFE